MITRPAQLSKKPLKNQDDCLGFHYDKIKTEMLRGPRVTTLFKYFQDIASKKTLIPKVCVEPSQEFLGLHKEYIGYYKIHRRNLGAFNSHSLASIPYGLEECIRIGVTVSKYSEHVKLNKKNPFKFYGISSADGTQARTLAEYSKGRILTLTDSPNKENETEFNRLLNHNYSFFHLGSFVDITPEYLLAHKVIAFHNGFDLIWENVAFQMYGRNRCEQIAYVKRVLKNDGIMILAEKLNHQNPNEYYRMEQIKDELFKSKYFTKFEIETKKTTILSEMEKCQVTISELSSAVKQHFKYAHIVWNSTNFYEIVASNNKNSMDNFLSFLPEPYVPYPFAFEYPIVQPLF